MSEAPCCPTCGQTLKTDRSEVMALMGLKVSIMQKSVLRELIQAWPGSLTVERLVWLLYGGRDEPNKARENILVFIHRLRKSIKETGWSITNKGGMRGGRGWKAEYALEKKPSE